jgi:hypothetical protein
VDRRLIAEGRLTRVERAEDVRLERRREARPRAFRDPELLVDLLLDAGRDVPRRR